MNQPPAPAGYGAPVQPSSKTNTMAVLSLVFAFVFSPLGIVFGVMGRSQTRRTGERGRGMATAGMVLSIVFLVVSLIVVALTVVAAIAVSSLPLTVSSAKVAQEISDKATIQLGSAPDSVICAGDLPAIIGASVQCTLNMAGDTTPVTATVTSIVGGTANFDITTG